jgi:hypothetical protein
MIGPTASQNRHATASPRRRLTAPERLERDRRPAQHAATVLAQARRAAAGNGRGWAMTRYAKSMASS